MERAGTNWGGDPKILGEEPKKMRGEPQRIWEGKAKKRSGDVEILGGPQKQGRETLKLG